MREDEEIGIIYRKKEDIGRIIDKIRNFSFRDLKKTRHYEMSILQKNTDEKELEKYFPKFEIIKMILYRKRKSGYDNYDFHYEKEDGTYIIFSIHTDKDAPELVNGVIVERNFKKFMEYVLKKYHNV